MSLADVLEGLGGLSRGIMQGQDFNQRQQYNQYLLSMAEQQRLEQQRQQEIRSGLGSTLRQYFAQQGDTGQPTPTTGQGAQPLQPFQQQQPLQLPQVPQATTQMNLSGGGLPGIVANLESGGGRDVASQPPSMVDKVYGQYADFAGDYGRGAPGVQRFAQAELRARPGATFGDYYSDYVLGTGRPGSHTISDLASNYPSAYKNLINNAGIPPSTPLSSLAGAAPDANPAFSVLPAPLPSQQGDPRIQLASANQTYTQLKAQMPPPVAQASAVGASNTLRAMPGQPLQLAGRLQPADLWKAIDTANPNVPDDIKAGIFTNLYPMLSQQGKIDFADAMHMFNYQERVRHDEAMEQKPPAGMVTGGAPYQPTDAEGKPIGPPGQVMGGRFQPIQGLPEGSGVARVGTKPTGQQAVDSTTVDATAKAISEYRLPPLSGWTLKSPWGQAVNAKIFQYNPDYAAPQYSAAVSGERAFTSGPLANQVRSMSVAIDHLAVAEDLGKALQTGDSRTLNAVTQELKKQFGYEGPVDFDTAKMIVGDEVTKAVAGGNLSMTERTALQSQFSTASSPEQLTGVASTLKRLLGGQLRGLERQYQAVPGQKPSFEDKLSPQAREQLEGTPGGGAQAGATGDISTMNKQQLIALVQGGSLTEDQLTKIRARMVELQKAPGGGQ